VITWLYLKGQSFSDISFLTPNFTSLKILNLSFNNLEELGPVFNLKGLQNLDVNHNLISHLSADFKNFVELKQLNLSHNWLESISELSALKYNPMLEKLNVKENPFLDMKNPLESILAVLPTLINLNNHPITFDI